MRDLPFCNHEFLDTERIAAHDAMIESEFRYLAQRRVEVDRHELPLAEDRSMAEGLKVGFV